MKRLKVYKECDDYEEVYQFKKGFKKVFLHIKNLVEKANLSAGVECYVKNAGEDMWNPELSWGHIMYPLSRGYSHIDEYRYLANKYCYIGKLRNHFTDKIETFYIRGIRFDSRSIMLNISCNDTKLLGCELDIKTFFECNTLIEVIDKSLWQKCPYSISMYNSWSL